MRNTKSLLYTLYSPVLFWLAIIIIVPHIDLLYRSFIVEDFDGNSFFSFKNYYSFFTDSIYWATFSYTAFIAIGVTFLSFLVTFPVAFYIAKVVSNKIASFLVLLLLLPIWIGELVAIYGWVILLGDHGIINELLIKIGLINTPIEVLYTNFSMILGLLYMSMLFMILPMMSTLDDLDNSLIEAATNLGASKFKILRTIILPHTIPGIVSGSIIVFMLVIGDFVAPNILGGKSTLWFTEQIYNKFLATFNWGEGAAFGFILLMLSSSIVWVALKLSGQSLKNVGS